jgi:PKD repeat protein
MAGISTTASCQPAATTTPTIGAGIKKLIFANINRVSGDATEGNKDFSCNQPANLIAGNVYELTIETGPPPAQRSKAWIDYNNDGTFDPVTELVGSSNVYIFTTTFLIRTPVNVILNTPLRMRVSADINNTNITACGGLFKGQYEDYSVIFTSQLAAPEIAFKATQTQVVPGFSTNFTDMTNFQPTGWQWFFDGGNPATSTAQNPTGIFYASSGTYSVRLIATNALGTDTLTKSAYIRVGNGITATAEEISTFKDLIIYPNPAGNVVKVQYGFAGKKEVTLTLLNSLGQEISTQTKRATDMLETELNVTNVAAGVYMLRIYNGENQTTRKLILQK